MESSDEVWIPIPGYEELYEVSNFGRVKSLPKEIIDPNGRVRKYKSRIMKQQTVNKYGHLKVGLYKDKKCKEYLVHRLVLLAFVGYPPKGMEGLHKDGVPSNNNLTNLRWGTSKENSEDSITHGTIARGSLLPQSKLTEDDVIAILNDNRTSTLVAKDYNVSPRTIRSIRERKNWKHIQLPKGVEH